MIYLVGSGPGDPGLFTVKGVRCMEAADAVVYDRLAPEALLKYARPEAEKIYVGKKPGNPTMSQEEISDLLVTLGRAGKERRDPRGREGTPGSLRRCRTHHGPRNRRRG